MLFTEAQTGIGDPAGMARPPTWGAAPGGQGDGFAFRSQGLELFSSRLNQVKEPLLLDVGPVCSANINLWARRAKTLFVCDMFIRLGRQLDSQKPPEAIWRHLDYPKAVFHGIFCWDFLDRLEETQARTFVKMCLEMVRPGGMMLLTALPEDAHAAGVSSFAQGEEHQISLQAQPHLDLPLFTKPNRRILSLLLPFFPIKSFIYRNGYREFLVQRPGD